MAKFVNLLPGDPAPWFTARSSSNQDYHFNTIAGRYLVLCFYGSANSLSGKAALAAIKSQRNRFDDRHVSIFAVTNDPADLAAGRHLHDLPGLRSFFDFDCAIGKAYGAVDVDHDVAKPPRYVRQCWVVLDPTLRVMQVIPYGGQDCLADKLFAYLDQLPPVSQFAGIELQAPILFLPNVFEPDLCAQLIEAYETHGGKSSGFMRQIDGKTHMIMDPSHKVRSDYQIESQELRDQTLNRVVRRVVPEIRKIHHFHVTRMERYIVSCYSEEDGGHFRPHRDNTTSATEHRRFAVSINLNHDFDGGEICFPEYGPRTFKPPPGGACIFSCSLLHAVTTVTRGKRYAFLPFLYDDAAAKIRLENNKYLAEGVTAYAAGNIS